VARAVNEFIEILTRLSAAGFGTLMAAILYGGYKGVWVWGKDYRKLEEERDRWMHIALRNTLIAEKSTQVRASLSGEILP